MKNTKMTFNECDCSSPALPIPPSDNSTSTHITFHKQWLHGVPLLPTAFQGVRDGIGIVTVKSKQSEWTVARRLAVMLRNEGGHDGALWDRYRYSMSREQEQPHAFIAIQERTAIGIAIVRSYDTWSYKRGDGQWSPCGRHSYRKPCIDGLFVCVNCRRRGIASHLVQAVATYYGLPSTSDVAWLLPLSDAGRAVAWACSGFDGGIYLV